MGSPPVAAVVAVLVGLPPPPVAVLDVELAEVLDVELAEVLAEELAEVLDVALTDVLDVELAEVLAVALVTSAPPSPPAPPTPAELLTVVPVGAPPAPDELLAETLIEVLVVDTAELVVVALEEVAPPELELALLPPPPPVFSPRL
ncbi:hypothetical protein [Sorangium sp. So ce1389]|uniref:hypothetical protein n=1 Tax=Sorangium sp. So ce1389 TaxID=3133336 RepID=UPI003F5E28B5